MSRFTNYSDGIPGPQGPAGDPANTADFTFSESTMNTDGDMTIGVVGVPGEITLSAYSGVNIQYSEQNGGAYLNGVAPENQIATIGDLPLAIETMQYGSFTSIITQTGTVNSIQPIYCEQTEFNKGIVMENSSGGTTNASRIKIINTGRYNIQFSLQLNQGNSQGTVNIWLRKNGEDVPNSNTKMQISANDPYQVAAWNFFVDAAANDYYEIMWSSTSVSTQIEYVDPAGAHPAVPSVILTISQIGL